MNGYMNGYLIKFSRGFGCYAWEYILASSFKKLIKKFVWAYMSDPYDWQKFSEELGPLPEDDGVAIVKVAHQYLPVSIEAVTTVEIPSILFMKDAKEDRLYSQTIAFQRIEDETL